MKMVVQTRMVVIEFMLTFLQAPLIRYTQILQKVIVKSSLKILKSSARKVIKCI